MEYGSMPGPRPLPLLGNSWRFALGKLGFGNWKTKALDAVLWSLRARAAATGAGAAKVSRLHGHPDLVFPFCAEQTARVYRREDAMPHRARAPCLAHYKHDLRAEFFGEEPGLIGVHGAAWSRFRSRVSRDLIAPEAARAAIPELDAVAEDFLARMDTMLDDQRQLPVDFLTELYKWALESVGAWALGARLGCLSDSDAEAREIIRCIHGFFHAVPELELSAPLWRAVPTPAYNTYVASLDTFRELCMRIVKQHLATHAGGGGGACGRVAAQSGWRAGAILALDLLLVGVDTTAAAAATTLYLLARNPRAQAKLQRELDSQLPRRRGEAITSQHVNRLTYLKACIKEALRMKPVILGNGRCLQSDALVSGYRVPKGTHIVFPHYILSNEERYFPSPDSFIPERWMRTEEPERERTGVCEHAARLQASQCEHVDSEREKDCAHAADVTRKQKEIGIHPFASLPFGFGRRMCIGKRFAEAELVLFLAKVFSRYQVSWEHDELTYSVTPTYLPNEPLQYTLHSRTRIPSSKASSS